MKSQLKKYDALARKTPTRNQRGLSLIVVLLMLSAVFLIVSFSARLSLLAERAARNDRDRQIAFQSAEAALGDAEIDIMGGVTATNRRDCPIFGDVTAYQLPAMFVEGCGSSLLTAAGPPFSTLGLCAQNTGTTPLYQSVLLAAPVAGNNKYVQYGEITGLSAQLITGTAGTPALPPRYIVELIPYNYISAGARGAGAGTQTGSSYKAFQVTALGFGLNRQTQVMLQSIIAKPGLTGGC